MDTDAAGTPEPAAPERDEAAIADFKLDLAAPSQALAVIAECDLADVTEICRSKNANSTVKLAATRQSATPKARGT